MARYCASVFLTQWGLLEPEVWFEPFGGGLGAGLTLLANKVVSDVWFCETNPALAAFWDTLCDNPEGFARRVETYTPTLDGYYSARDAVNTALAAPTVVDRDDLGFAAFVMNRCSRSGMIGGTVGPIGGKAQTGPHTVQSRFNPARLARRIRDLQPLTTHIRRLSGSGIDRIEELDGGVGLEEDIVMFVDPPYSDVGNRLYTHGMTWADHQRLAWALNTSPCWWMLTYDATPRILSELYPHRDALEFSIRHTAHRGHADTEYLIFSDNLAVDQSLNPIPGKPATWRWGEDATSEQFALPV